MMARTNFVTAAKKKAKVENIGLYKFLMSLSKLEVKVEQLNNYMYDYINNTNHFDSKSFIEKHTL